MLANLLHLQREVKMTQSPNKIFITNTTKTDKARSKSSTAQEKIQLESPLSPPGFIRNRQTET